jgi:hypothetical protein
MPTPWEKAMPQPSTRNKFQHPSHGQYTDESEQSSSSEEEEVEDIIIDDHLRPRSKSAELMEWRRKHREEINKNRMLRREKITRAEMKYAETRNNNVTSDASMLDLSQGYGPSTPTARSVPPESPGKRKGVFVP